MQKNEISATDFLMSFRTIVELEVLKLMTPRFESRRTILYKIFNITIPSISPQMTNCNDVFLSTRNPHCILSIPLKMKVI